MFMKDLKGFKEALDDLEVLRGISKEFIIDSIKEGIISAYAKTHGADSDIEVEISEDFDIRINIVKRVVSEVLDEKREILLKDAQKINEDASLGDEILLEEDSNFKRNAIQNAKNLVIQRVREAEKNILVRKFKSKIGQIVSGLIRRVDVGGNVFLEIEKSEVILGREEQTPSDIYKVGKYIQVYLVDVLSETKLPKVLISRSHPKFVEELFKFEVPEITAGIIEIKGISRDPGFRTKVAIHSKSEAIDPIGACVGNKGMRIKAISNQINEKIDIVLWHQDLATYVENALKPAEIEQVIIKNDRIIEVKVKANQLALTVGKKGQNAKLAAKLVGCKINIEEV